MISDWPKVLSFYTERIKKVGVEEIKKEKTSKYSPSAVIFVVAVFVMCELCKYIVGLILFWSTLPDMQ